MASLAAAEDWEKIGSELSRKVSLLESNINFKAHCHACCLDCFSSVHYFAFIDIKFNLPFPQCHLVQRES